jgi:hypothetical protein
MGRDRSLGMESYPLAGRGPAQTMRLRRTTMTMVRRTMTLTMSFMAVS